MDTLKAAFDPASNSFWNLLLAVGLVGGSLLAARYSRRAIRRKLRQYDGLDEYAGSAIGRFTGWAIVFIGVLLALSVMGVDMVPVALAVAVIVAFLVFSGQTMIQNWSAGLLLQSRAPYRPGDRIESQSYVGDVETTNARSVVLRQRDGQLIHIPNIDVLRNSMVNRSGDEGGRRSSIDFGVAYGSDLDAAERILVESAASVSGVRAEPPPSAWVGSLGDTNVVIEPRFWHDFRGRQQVRSAVAHEALRRLDAAGISMPFPTQELRITGEIDGPRSSETPGDV